ncbi:T9SS type A sorting domain-containing protein [bacterium]|nr:T9SS type A sorting domain-containing protein [bacterium]
MARSAKFFTNFLALAVSAVCFASESNGNIQTKYRACDSGREVQFTTPVPVASPAAPAYVVPSGGGEIPISAVGSLLWQVGDAVGLMDNVAIADNGSIAAIGVSLNNHSLRVFDAVSGALNYEVPGNDGLSSVAVSPNGSHVVWCQNRALRVYPGDEGNEIWSLTLEGNHSFNGMALSSDGEWIVALATIGPDTFAVMLLSTATGEQIGESYIPNTISNNHWIGAKISGDGSRIVATTRFRIYVLDSQTGAVVWNEDGRNTEHPATISGDGRIIATAANNDGKVHCYIWDEANSTYIQFWEYRFSGGTSNWGTATAVSRNGETIAAGSMQFTSTGFEGYVAVFETNGGGVPLWVSAGMGDLVGGMEISDDGLTIAACSWGYLNDSQPDIRVWQKYSSTPFYTYTHPGSPNDLDISADGTRLIAGGKGVHNRTFGNGGRAYVFELDLEGGSVGGSVDIQGTNDDSGVWIEAIGTHLHAFSSASGAYQIDHIPAGTYTITARKLGYSTASVSNVVVTEDGLTGGVNFVLTPMESPPQNLIAVSGQLTTIGLSWDLAGLARERARELEALYAVGDILQNPALLPGPVRSIVEPGWALNSEPRNGRDGVLDDPDSIHVWRAPLSGGPYSLVASISGSLTSYNDSLNVYPGVTYYYVVTGVYSNGETSYSNEAAGALDDSYLVYDPVVPAIVNPVVFDGILSPNEWSDAVRIDISDVLGYDGRNAPQTAFLYMKYDDTADMLYLACEDHANPSLDDGEGFGIYVDDDDSDTWTYSRPGSEGNYWAYYFASGSTLRYRSLSGAPYNVDPYYSFTNPQIGFSTSAGYFTGEVAIPLGFHELYETALYGPDKTPGIGFFVIQRQAGVAIFDGYWPQNIPSIVSNPEYFSNSSIQATLAVPPAAPGNVQVTRNGNLLNVTWEDPTLGIDDLPVAGLAGIKLYRNGELLDYVPIGEEVYTDETVAYGAWYDYSLSGFIMEGEEDFDGPRSLAVGEYAGAAPEVEYLVYDDGTWEFFMIVSGLYDQNRFAVRCDMPPDRDFVYTVQLAVNSIAPIGIGVADDNGGVPGAQQFGPYFIIPPVALELFTVHIPGENPPAPFGSFWTTLDWASDRPSEPGIATDGNGNEGRSFWHQGATGWQNQPSNFMIRTGVGDIVSEANQSAPGIVYEYGLQQNYPNPFNPETVIPFTLGRSGDAQLAIYNITGQLITTLVSGNQPAGHHVVRWNGRDAGGVDLSSGIYFARLTSGEFTQTRKLMLLK